MNKTLAYFNKCIKMMHKNGREAREEGYSMLVPYAGYFITELLREFNSETDILIRHALLELIAEARLMVAFPTFVNHLYDEDESLRYSSIRGLKLLGTKESRQILWEAHNHLFPTEKEIKFFRQELDNIQ